MSIPGRIELHRMREANLDMDARTDGIRAPKALVQSRVSCRRRPLETRKFPWAGDVASTVRRFRGKRSEPICRSLLNPAKASGKIIG